ncbi:hypothetical protein RJ55_05772 [Drechmeria coniospora]|nr:hypothetical protein RJ55_05772 [Drechmeria coniospora]
MAFAARLGDLTADLLTSLTQLSSETDPDSFHAKCDGILRTLKSHPYTRTNQFEVQHSLDGLDERFRVNNRDDLADALAQRLRAFQSQPSKWHPEALSFLLELSDQPTFKARLSDLDALRRRETEPRRPLRWEDISKEDGWDDDEDENLWKSAYQSNESTDGDDDEEAVDEETEDDDDDGGDVSGHSGHTTIPSDEELVGRSTQHLVVHTEKPAVFNAVLEAQKWRVTSPSEDPLGRVRRIAVPEVQAMREILFMLQGLDCTLFSRRGAVDPKYQLENMAWETHAALMATYADHGRQLHILHRFVNRSQSVPHLQALQDCITKRLGDFARKLSSIQSHLISPNEDVVVSLLALNEEILPFLGPLFALARIIAMVEERDKAETFLYLELLFDATSMAQLAGELDIYHYLARVFVDCFGVYLRNIRHWMDEGTLLPTNELFFITEASSDLSLSGTWQDKFALRKMPDGRLHAPSFLQPAAEKIFTAGKNTVVLRLLGTAGAVRYRHEEDEPPLDYDAICPAGFELAPFADLFSTAFDRWIQSKYRTTSATLKKALVGDWAMLHTLDAMQTLFLMSDGSAATTFCERLFRLMDMNPASWSDSYGLTAAGHEAFSSLVDANRLSIGVEAAGCDLSASQVQSSVKMAPASVAISYKLPWPLRMVITKKSTKQYRSVFTLLLQIRRAMYALHKPKILENLGTDGDGWQVRALFYSSRSQLLWFCNSLQTYLVTLVLEPACSKMRADLAAADGIDDMIAAHADAMKQMVDQACLGSNLKPIREAMLDVLDLAITLEHGRARALEPEEGDAGRPYGELLRDIEQHFHRHLNLICGGLRRVARESNNAQSAKWDFLADMLQAGNVGEA